MTKQRLDLILVERGLSETRTKAQAMIMAGEVRSGEQLLTKSGGMYVSDIALEVTSLPRYVSRGGDKLASIALELGFNPEGAIVLDVGSSTGGFTDYCLQHGAVQVYCVDAGTDQNGDPDPRHHAES